jgi:nucleoside 2-deoxyribosyltransferase
MKVYLSGPISNNPNYKKDFEEAKEEIEDKERGIEVFSPVDLNLDGEEWRYCMRKALKMMLSCDVVVVLNSISTWVSHGSVLEQLIAHEIGMNVYTFDDFCLPFLTPFLRPEEARHDN